MRKCKIFASYSSFCRLLITWWHRQPSKRQRTVGRSVWCVLRNGNDGDDEAAARQRRHSFFIPSFANIIFACYLLLFCYCFWRRRRRCRHRRRCNLLCCFIQTFFVLCQKSYCTVAPAASFRRLIRCFAYSFRAESSSVCRSIAVIILVCPHRSHRCRFFWGSRERWW